MKHVDVKISSSDGKIATAVNDDGDFYVSVDMTSMHRSLL